MIGQQVNKYRLVRLLGEGGMGAVYEAEHATLRRKVAVKVLRRELVVDRNLVERFMNEARAANSIRHPNIIEIVDVGLLEDGVPYLMMELLEGESVARRLVRQQRMAIAEAVDIALQSASALGAAHANGIVHRDLKPDNLFLIPDERFAGCELVKVLDFGIAKLRVDLSGTPVNTMAGVVFGTPPYMSPEQCRGLQGEVDYRADIYALGIILYELLCGKPPFYAPAYGDVMIMHMTVPPPSPSHRRPDLPSALEAVILRALAKNRDDRFQSMAELSAALARFAELPGGASSTEKRRQRISLPAPPEKTVPLAVAPGSTAAGHGTPSPAGPLSYPPAAALGRAPRSRRVRWAVTAGLSLVVLIAGATVIKLGGDRPRTGGAGSVSTERHRAATAPPAASIRPEVTPLPSRALPEPAAAPAASTAEAVVPKADARELPRPAGRRARRAALAAPAGATAVMAPAESRPAEAAAAPGFLSLDSAPWANVSVGGRQLGSTPLLRVALPPGRHVLTLTNPELGTSTTYVVEIKAGVALSRFVGWEKE